MDLKKLPRKLIGEILIEEGFLEAEELKKGLQVQKREGGLIGEILVREGWVSEDELMACLSKQLSLPFIRLSNYNINRNTARTIPRELAERYLVIAIDQDEDDIFLAMSDPGSQDALEEIQKKVTLGLQVYLSTPSEIRQAIGTYYGE